MQADNIDRFLARVDECHSTGGLLEAFETLLGEESLGHYAVLRIPVISETSVFRILCHQLPENWIDFYMDRGYHLIDPVLRHLASAQGFYRFGEAHVAFEKDAHRRGIERLAADRSRFGIEDGYLFPVYGRLGLLGAVALCGRRSDLPPLSLYLINAAANHLFRRLLSIGGEDASRPAPSDRPASMTRREKEVLALLAEGMTSHEIARELNISNHTVDWYVNGLQDKLEARNRQHAISLAFRRGLLA